MKQTRLYKHSDFSVFKFEEGTTFQGTYLFSTTIEPIEGRKSQVHYFETEEGPRFIFGCIDIDSAILQAPNYGARLTITYRGKVPVEGQEGLFKKGFDIS